METLNRFLKNLCGEFNNDKQVNKELELGESKHPKARHINAICNDKIKNLPNDFNGYFVIEESYYDLGTRQNILPHLFLFTLNEEGKVVLTSYDLPEGVTKEEFRNNNEELVMDYNNLTKSGKFTPMVYTEENGVFHGECVSEFGPDFFFTLKETTKENQLIVSEVFRKNGKITFGFEDPIVYDRIK